MIILLRILPFAGALFEAVIFMQQIRHPLKYPWIVLAGVAALPLASALIAWKRVSFFDTLEKMTPSFVLIGALAFALLLSETFLSYVVITLVAAIATLVSLELLFTLAFDPSRYPVNALSRVNIGYVPLIFWFTASNSTGLLTFVRMPKFWHIAIMVAVASVLFRTTGHPGATREQNAVWTSVGALIGLNVGLLGVFLPVSMQMQGIIATLLLCSVLRARRYMYDPKPSKRQAWIEGFAALAFLVAVLATAKWL